MKLVNYSLNEHHYLGWLQEDQNRVLRIDSSIAGLPNSMEEVIQIGGEVIKNIQSAESLLEAIDLKSVKLRLPLESPAGIFCVGHNYSADERQAPVEGTDYPTIFTRLARSQVAHGEAIVLPSCSPTLDWEGELVAVIGKQGRRIPANQAMEHIFGYSIYNEASIREYIKHSGQVGLVKLFDDTGAFGPCIVTADEFGNPYEQTITTDIDGEVVQSAKIDLMTHRIEDLIAYFSQSTTLYPGDLICTGTPAGIGVKMKPPRFLKAGETVSVEISGIGKLVNPVVSE